MDQRRNSGHRPCSCSHGPVSERAHHQSFSPSASRLRVSAVRSDAACEYEAVRAHFATELAAFRGSRAIFIHSARYSATPGFVFDLDADEYAAAIQANAVAPLVLGRMFLSAAGPDFESGLMLISSAAANYPLAGCAAYCAARAGLEMWVKAVSAELKAKNADVGLGGATGCTRHTACARIMQRDRGNQAPKRIRE